MGGCEQASQRVSRPGVSVCSGQTLLHAPPLLLPALLPPPCPAALLQSPSILLPTPLQVNALILAGQYWRLLTPAFLHGSITHLAVNCFSLNNLGPTVEATAG